MSSKLQPPKKYVAIAADVTNGYANISDAPVNEERWLWSITGDIDRAGVLVKLGIEDESGGIHWLKSENQPGGTEGVVNWTGKTPIPVSCKLKAYFKGVLVAGDIMHLSAITEAKET